MDAGGNEWQKKTRKNREGWVVHVKATWWFAARLCWGRGGRILKQGRWKDMQLGKTRGESNKAAKKKTTMRLSGFPEKEIQQGRVGRLRRKVQEKKKTKKSSDQCKTPPHRH